MSTLRPLVLLLVLGSLACQTDPEDTDSDPHTDTDTDAVTDSSCEVCHTSEDALKASLPDDTDTEPVDEGES